jgi:rubrerythrin
LNNYKSYTSNVLEICDNGDAIIELPPELCKEMGWDDGTVLNIESKDGAIYLNEVKPMEKNMSLTIKNLEAAFAGESQAHTKYRYFAKLARAEGFEDVAKHFEHTADQELLHAWGHLELLIGKPDTKKCLEMAIEGETEEFTNMYPTMKAEAIVEGNQEAEREAAHQIAESEYHAQEFRKVLAKAEKRFAALAKVEERHATAYQKMLQEIQ